MAKFLIVTFNYGGDPEGQEKIQATVETAMDWYRFAPYAWVLWTNRSAAEWYGLIQPKLGDQLTFFVCELNTSHRQGWMQMDFWDWLNKSRE